MLYVVIILAVLILAGIVTWIYLKKRKPEPQPTPEPEPDPEPKPDPEPEPEPEPVIVCNSRAYGLDYKMGAEEKKGVKVGIYDVNSVCGCTWKVKEGSDTGFLSNIKFSRNTILATIEENLGEERTVKLQVVHTGKGGTWENTVEVTQKEGWMVKFKEIMKAYPEVKEGMKTYDYLGKLYQEGFEQFYKGKSLNGLPTLHTPTNFPNIHDFYGQDGNEEAAFKTLIGWLFSLTLSELTPKKRTDLMKRGYELGGYDKYSKIYGYRFEYDPSVCRLTASALYASLRSILKPDIEGMREELGGTKYTETLGKLMNGTRENVGEDDFFIDFRTFMPTAPGPYAPGYTSRPDNTYPSEEKDKYGNLKVDREIHEEIVEKYNLDDQICVQAIADKEADTKHLFGDPHQTEHYHFIPVFGEDSIGKRIETDGKVATLVSQSITASSSSRGILQSAKVVPPQYGRLRPGCSWKQEATKNSKTDDRRNVLTKFEIEDGDGNPTGYYDKNGNWVYPNAIGSAAEYEESQKNSLWANSYPSGHSSGIWGGAMCLMELMPERTDLIMKAANWFAIERTIARYHWTSDTINGRVLGSATNAVSHASSDYDEMLEKAKGEL